MSALKYVHLTLATCGRETSFQQGGNQTGMLHGDHAGLRISADRRCTLQHACMGHLRYDHGACLVCAGSMVMRTNASATFCWRPLSRFSTQRRWSRENWANAGCRCDSSTAGTHEGHLLGHRCIRESGS